MGPVRRSSASPYVSTKKIVSFALIFQIRLPVLSFSYYERRCRMPHLLAAVIASSRAAIFDTPAQQFCRLLFAPNTPESLNQFLLIGAIRADRPKKFVSLRIASTDDPPFPFSKQLCFRECCCCCRRYKSKLFNPKRQSIGLGTL